VRADAGGVGRGRAGRLTPPEGLRAALIETARLRLVPLAVDDAAEMAGVLADPSLYVFTGGEPPTEALLRRRYALQVAGASPNGAETWLNWVLRVREGGEAAGYVQATVTGSGDIGRVADIAWVLGVPWQGHGYASEAASAMRAWLEARGVARVTAHVLPGHVASEGVARRVGLQPTETIEDGERVWSARHVPAPATDG
jgi:RimJ/RimL family protein N-acetyltransferase